MKLVIAPGAQLRMLDIYAYTLGRWGEKKAIDYLTALDQTIQLIRQHPHVGKHYPGTQHAWLYFNHGHEYRVFYRATRSTLFILRILHQRQDPTAPSR